MSFASFQNSDSVTLEAKQALLFYQAKHGNGALCILHDIVTDEAGQLVLGSGRAPTIEFAKILARTLTGLQPLEMIDKRIIATGQNAVVWWTPAAKRSLLFRTESPEINALSGRSFACPPLLFLAEGQSLFVRALLENTRPGPDARTATAPFPNVNGATGAVCLGSAVPPRRTSPATIGEWESCFFDSYFTHTHGGITTSHPGKITGLIVDWAAMDKFPTKYLVRLKETVSGFMANRNVQ